MGPGQHVGEYRVGFGDCGGVGQLLDAVLVEDRDGLEVASADRLDRGAQSGRHHVDRTALQRGQRRAVAVIGNRCRPGKFSSAGGRSAPLDPARRKSRTASRRSAISLHEGHLMIAVAGAMGEACRKDPPDFRKVLRA